MWLSWKLFYEKGGYAFIAFGVDVASNKKFKIEFNEKYLFLYCLEIFKT